MNDFSEKMDPDNFQNFKETDIYDQEEIGNDVAPIQYDISSYGADYTLDALVKRLKKGDIFIPDFQRDYVWNLAEASRLIESLLLGLPVPGVFFAKEPDTNKLLVIDGQQRLKSIQFFYDEYFNPNENSKSKRIFKLIKVQKKFEGRTYSTLEENDRIKLDDSIIHATVIKQESPDGDNTSIYHVFERLNSGGKKLTSQEIRSAIYYGELNNLIFYLNKNESWRNLFGPPNIRLKDEELILRFFAVMYNEENYEKPMTEFLTKFNKKFRNPNSVFISKSEDIFIVTMKFIWETLGRNAFRLERSLNVSVFEAISIATTKLITKKGIGGININTYKQAHANLIKDELFVKSVTRGTSDEAAFKERHSIAEKFILSL